MADQESLQIALDSWARTVGSQTGPNLPILQCGEAVRCVNGEVDQSRRCIGALDRDGGPTVEGCNPCIDIGALANEGFLRNAASITTADTERNTTAENEPSGRYGWYLNFGGAVDSFPPLSEPIPVPAPQEVPEIVVTIEVTPQP